MQRPPLRVGSVPYIVGRPLDLGLENELGIAYSRAVPAELVDGLRRGSLDVALVSTIELFRLPGYRYIEGAVVAGRGFVSSVQLFLRVPLAEARSIALDPASRTSAVLLQALLAERLREGLQLLSVQSGSDPRAAPADGWLRIGDRALEEYFEPASPHLYNPSQAWCQQTGLPFIFAAWIVRPGVEIEPYLPAFERARQRGKEALPHLAEDWAQSHSLPRAGMRRYLLEECVYTVRQELAQALEAFRDAAAEAGACPASLPLSGIPLPTDTYVAIDPR